LGGRDRANGVSPSAGGGGRKKKSRRRGVIAVLTGLCGMIAGKKEERLPTEEGKRDIAFVIRRNAILYMIEEQRKLESFYFLRGAGEGREERENSLDHPFKHLRHEERKKKEKTPRGGKSIYTSWSTSVTPKGVGKGNTKVARHKEGESLLGHLLPLGRKKKKKQLRKRARSNNLLSCPLCSGGTVLGGGEKKKKKKRSNREVASIRNHGHRPKKKEGTERRDPHAARSLCYVLRRVHGGARKGKKKIKKMKQ